MSDVVVTVPKARWADWLSEGDLAGQQWSGETYGFTLASKPPQMMPGDRVYIVAHGKLRGYSPLQAIAPHGGGFVLIRGNGAVAVTIPEPIVGFMGWRYRWWEREIEVQFPNWKIP